MPVAGISSSNMYDPSSLKVQNRSEMQQEFQQLGSDLSSGNLSAAQADFAAVEKQAPTGSSSKASTISQKFGQLGQDLQSGDLTSAQQDYSSIQQTMQQHAAGGHHHHRGHHENGESGSNAMSQLFGQLGEALQYGNLTQAQQAYTTLQQEWQALAQNGGENAQTTSTGVTATA